MKKQTRKLSKTALLPEAIADKGVVTNCDLKIAGRIRLIRGIQVMLDWDIAELYGVETRALNQAVKRNIERFPRNFRFQLTKEELAELITNCDKSADATILDVLSGKGAGVIVRLVCRDRGKPTVSEIAKFNRQYKGLTVSYSDDFHDRFVIIDNAELHNFGSSVNSLGRRVSTYSTRDAKEIKKLISLLP